MLATDAGDWDAADGLFDEAVRADDKSIGNRILQAWFYLRRTDRKHDPDQQSHYLVKAEELAERVLSTDEHCVPAYACLGAIRYRRKQYQAAEDFLRRSVERDPFSGYYVQLASVLNEVRRFEEAEQLLRRYLDFSWYDAQAHMQLGTVLLRTRRPAEAQEELRRARTLAPDNVSAAARLAVALAEENHLDEAADVLRDVIGRGPRDDEDDVTLRMTLAWVLIKWGEQEDRPELFEEVLTLVEKRRQNRVPSELRWYAVVALQKLSASAPWRRLWYREKARKELKQLKAADHEYFEKNSEARHVEAELRRRESEVLARGTLAAFLSLALLLVLWIAFLFHQKDVSGVTLATMTPVLIALALVASVLPIVSRLRVAGVEAELREQQPPQEDLARPIDFRQISAVVTAQQTLWASFPELTDYLPEEIVGFLLPVRSLTTSSKVQKSPSDLVEILRKGGIAFERIGVPFVSF